MGSDTEFWTVVINGGANLVIAGAMVAQTFLFLVSLKLAADKIRDIEKQVYLSNREQSKREAISNLQLVKQNIYYGFAQISFDFNDHTLKRYHALNSKKPIYGEDIIDKLKLSIEVTWFFVTKKTEFMNPLVALSTNLTLLNSDYFESSFKRFENSIIQIIKSYSDVNKMIDQIISEDSVILKDLLEKRLKSIPNSHIERNHPLFSEYYDSSVELEEKIISYTK